MTFNRNIFEWMQSSENPKLLVIMRGVPGSGKSYRAKELAGGDETVICSADDFFGRTTEEYVQNWTRDKLHAAHKWCQNNARQMMQRQVPLVVIDNTNIRIAEMMPYFDMAVQYEYRVEIHEPTSDWWLNEIAPYLLEKDKYASELKAAATKLWTINQSTHCVPLEAIERMLKRYQAMVMFQDLARSYERSLV